MTVPKYEGASSEERAFWDQVATVVARAEACKEPSTAARWADRLLEFRRQSFGAPKLSKGDVPE